MYTIVSSNKGHDVYDLWPPATRACRKHTTHAAHWLQGPHPEGFHGSVLTTTLTWERSERFWNPHPLLQVRCGTAHFCDTLWTSEAQQTTCA